MKVSGGRITEERVYIDIALTPSDGTPRLTVDSDLATGDIAIACVK